METAVGCEEAVGGEDVEMRVEDQVIAEGVDGGDGSEFAVGEIEAGAALLRHLLRQGYEGQEGYEGHSSLPLAFQWPAIRSFLFGSEEWWRL